MIRIGCVVAATGSVLGALAAAAPGQTWASHVVDYKPGLGVPAGYDNPQHALGEPARFSPDPQYPSAVTPFSPPYLPEHLVGIGPGGSLVVQFDPPIQNDPLNPFGIDLLVFGSAGLIYDSGVASGMFSVGNGIIEVSADGNTWHTISGVLADALYPTLGYLDITEPWPSNPGNVLSDFTRPVDPSFSPQGKTLQEILAAYAGSGGGTGVDIGLAGLSSASFVRISHPGAGETVHIDAFSRVTPIPAPAGAAIVTIGSLALLRRRR
jgi:hypothetical protein